MHFCNLSFALDISVLSHCHNRGKDGQGTFSLLNSTVSQS